MASESKIAGPKIDASLESRSQISLAQGIAIERAVVAEADWSSQSAHRGTFDTLILKRVDATGTAVRESGWQDCRLEAGQAGGADFTAASLRRLEMLELRASGLVMAEAEIRDVVFRNCKLDLANFRFARLTKVLFDQCLLIDSDFAGAQLNHVRFSACELTRADFSGAKLSEVDLRGSQVLDLKGVAGLGGAKMTVAQLMTLAPALASELGLEIEDS